VSACAVTPVWQSRCFRALADKGINIQVISTSEIKVSVLIAAEYTRARGANAAHTAYVARRRRMSHGSGAINFKLGGGRAASPRSPEHERLYCELHRLWNRGARTLGCEIAIMGGAMTWWSERNLVAAISNAGGFGVIASGSMSPELLSLEIGATRAMTTRPFRRQPDTLHTQLLELIDVCHRSSRRFNVVLAGGLPTSAAVGRIKQGGARVLCFAPALGFARKLVRMGVDANRHRGQRGGWAHRAGFDGGVGPRDFPQPRQCTGLRRRGWHRAGGGDARPISKWAPRGSSSGRALCAPTNRSPTRASSRRHPAPRQRDAVASVQLDPRFPGYPGSRFA